MGNEKGRPERRPQKFSRTFDRAMTVLTVAATACVVAVLVRMFVGVDPVPDALLRVVIIGVLWVVGGLLLAVVFPYHEPKARVPRPITTTNGAGGARVVPTQRHGGGPPRTVQGRFYLPRHALERPQLAANAVVIAAIADAVDGVVAAAERDGLALAWETIQVCLLPLPADRGGWQVLAEVEVVRP